MSESLDLIKNTIKVLKEEIIMLENQVKNYEKEVMSKSQNNDIQRPITFNKVQILFGKSYEKEFYSYMMNKLNLSEGTSKSYIFALKQIKNDMNDILGTNFEFPLFYINDCHELQKVIDLFEDSTDLREINYRRHNLFSAAYNNYYRFLETK